MKKTYNFAAILFGIFFTARIFAGASELQPGLELSVSNFDENVDATTAANVRIYVEAGKPPTPFLHEGKFTASWRGFLNVEMRGDYSFQAELNGSLKLEINGTNVLEASGTNSSSALSNPIRLAKGTNVFHATFNSAISGDSFVRLRWKPRRSFLRPIPSSAFTHFPSDAESFGKKLRLGRELWVEHRCSKCHGGAQAGMPELEMDAPSFEAIGSRRNFEWMARWIANPRKLRASAHMPEIFDGENAKSNSEAAAAFLTSLKTGAAITPTPEPNPADSNAGKKLFATLHCTACHNAPDAAKIDPAKISLREVRTKFPPGALVKFLAEPDEHYAWIRMPKFKLTGEQRERLSAYLISHSSAPEKSDKENAEMERGKKLVQTSGCLNCHSLNLKNQFAAKKLAELFDWNSGCLAEKPEKKSNAPRFNFSGEERDALQAFGATDHASLSRHVPAEFAERQSRVLNCMECHEKIEGVPRFEILGGKLKPEWSAKFIAGEISYKPRPWLEAQMPSFAKRAQLLAEGLAMQHGFPPQTLAEPPLDPKAAEIGRDLVSGPPHGFSCITCHAVGKFGAAQVFESPGINLAHSGERLLPGFFKRWLLSPQLVDPVSKMPTYFDEEGGSPLTDVYGGDGKKQIDAIWNYVRLGEKMPAPRME